MKKVFKLLTVLAIVFSILSGCGKNNQEVDSSTIIKEEISVISNAEKIMKNTENSEQYDFYIYTITDMDNDLIISDSSNGGVVLSKKQDIDFDVKVGDIVLVVFEKDDFEDIVSVHKLKGDA